MLHELRLTDPAGLAADFCVCRSYSKANPSAIPLEISPPEKFRSYFRHGANHRAVPCNAHIFLLYILFDILFHIFCFSKNNAAYSDKSKVRESIMLCIPACIPAFDYTRCIQMHPERNKACSVSPLCEQSVNSQANICWVALKFGEWIIFSEF